MQGLADGYFVLPATIGDYLAPLLGTAAGRRPTTPRSREAEAERRATQVEQLLVDQRHAARSTTSTASSARSCGTTAAWPAARESLEKALAEIPALREEFWTDVRVLGDDETLNQSLEKAGRVADFFEFGELLCRDALPPRGVAAAATSASSTRPRTARRCATTSTSPTSRAWECDGRRRRADAPQGAARRSSTSTSPSGATSSEDRAMHLTLHVWRQAGPDARRARSRPTTSPDVSEDMSFLEMLDVLNEQLIARGPRAGRVRPRLPRGHLRLVRA